MSNTNPARRQDLTPEMIRTAAVANGVCVRPIIKLLVDTVTGREQPIPIDCQSTQERQCPPCAERNRRLRMQQCREGWHTTEETLPPLPEPGDQANDEDQDDDEDDPDEPTSRRVRSTRRRQDVPDLPRVPVEHRSIGKPFTGNDGQT